MYHEATELELLDPSLGQPFFKALAGALARLLYFYKISCCILTKLFRSANFPCSHFPFSTSCFRKCWCFIFDNWLRGSWDEDISLDVAIYVYLLVHSHVINASVFTRHPGTNIASRKTLLFTVPVHLDSCGGERALRHTPPKRCRHGRNKVEIHRGRVSLGKILLVVRMESCTRGLSSQNKTPTPFQDYLNNVGYMVENVSYLFFFYLAGIMFHRIYQILEKGAKAVSTSDK